MVNRLSDKETKKKPNIDPNKHTSVSSFYDVEIKVCLLENDFDSYFPVKVSKLANSSTQYFLNFDKLYLSLSIIIRHLEPIYVYFLL